MEQEIPKQIIVTIITLLVVITLIVLILMVTLGALGAFGGVDSFKNSCESFGGYFWEITNVNYLVEAPNSMYMCSLNDEQFSMSDLGGDYFSFSYSKEICIRDCAYKNKQGGDYVCVC